MENKYEGKLLKYRGEFLNYDQITNYQGLGVMNKETGKIYYSTEKLLNKLYNDAGYKSKITVEDLLSLGKYDVQDLRVSYKIYVSEEDTNNFICMTEESYENLISILDFLEDNYKCKVLTNDEFWKLGDSLYYTTYNIVARNDSVTFVLDIDICKENIEIRAFKDSDISTATSVYKADLSDEFILKDIKDCMTDNILFIDQSNYTLKIDELEYYLRNLALVKGKKKLSISKIITDENLLDTIAEYREQITSVGRRYRGTTESEIDYETFFEFVNDMFKRVIIGLDEDSYAEELEVFCNISKFMKSIIDIHDNLY